MYLNCHSYYSLRYGTFSEVELLELAAKHKVKTLALTDINTTSACLNFIRKAPEFNIKPVVGIDFRIGPQQRYVGIAKNNMGFKQLNTLLSRHASNKIPLPERAPELKDAFFIYPFEAALCMEMCHFKANEYVGVSIAQLPKLRFSYLKAHLDRVVLLQSVTIRHKRDFNAHRLLRAIDNNILLSALDPSEECLETDRMFAPSEVIPLLEDFPEIIANTNTLLEQCHIAFAFADQRRSQNQKHYLTSAAEDYKLLLDLCHDGLAKRYPKPSPKILKRLETELETIQRLGYVAFFLINHDIVSYAKRKGYFYVGRGSGANSIVAYIIGITNVDPIELDLYFERFINPFRASPPDFDIDFSWKDREDITKYIFNRFEHTALLATYSTFKYRAVVRELGKVFGLPKAEIDSLSKGSAPPSERDGYVKLIVKYGKLIEGFPNYLSVHSAGILILEQPIHCYSATFIPPKGFPTVQFDMMIAEDVGIFKFDILGQRGLAKIKDALALIKENQPHAKCLGIHEVERFKKDPKINALLKSGGAIGAYYVESPAMRGLMQKLQTQDYLGLVAASSIIRPGVSGSGMKTKYIERHRHPEKRSEAHPVLLKIMPETYGIMVYQEDVLKVAHQFAGLTLGEADVLRRGMSGKFRSRAEFQAVEQKFISNCRDKGYDDELIFDVWHQIKSFAGYAFAKGHSASYAVESYQSLYLKCYFPIEFMTAVLNNGGGFYTTAHYIHEARMQGADICPPCINHSDHGNIVKGKAIYLGLGYLKNIETLVLQRILSERQLYGAFTSLDDFMDRIAIGIEQLTILVRIGAFRFTGKPPEKLLWHSIFKSNANRLKSSQAKLFHVKHKSYQLPDFKRSWLETAYDEFELLGFPLCSFFKLAAEDTSDGILAKDMPDYINKTVVIYGELVNSRPHKTAQGKLMRLSTFIDYKGNYFDAVHFSDAVKHSPINGMGIYACYGTIVGQFGFYSMKIIRSKKVGIFNDPRL